MTKDVSQNSRDREQSQDGLNIGKELLVAGTLALLGAGGLPRPVRHVMGTIKVDPGQNGTLATRPARNQTKFHQPLTKDRLNDTLLAKGNLSKAPIVVFLLHFTIA